MLNPSTLVEAAKEILAQSPFQETEVSLSAGDGMLTRYGDNKITQNVEQQKSSATIRATVRSGASGAKTAKVESDQLDSRSIQQAYARLKKILDVLPGAPDQDIAPLFQKGGKYEQPRREASQLPSPETAAAAAGKAASLAMNRGWQASGVYSANRQTSVFANSSGLVLHDTLSDSEFSCTFEGGGGAGRGFSNAIDPARLEVESSVQRALLKCEASTKNALALEPGKYDVVLEPAALAELLVFFGWISLSGKAYLEERSFCHGRLGQRVLNEKVTLIDDPLNPDVGGIYFDGQGVPKRKVKFFENGVLKELATDIKTANFLRREPTGHGVTEPNASDPVPWNIGLEWSGATAASSEELVSRVKRGILVTQFHYTNVVDIMVPSLTGMTRNGTFLIENGKVTRPIRNMRFTQSCVDFFDGIDAVTTSRERVSTFFGGASLSPSVLVRGFQFSSGTEF